MKNFKEITTLQLIILFLSIGINAQNYAGFSYDNYSGIHGLMSNPANVVGSPYKLDLTLASMSISANNDYAAADLSQLIQGETTDLLNLDVTETATSANNFNLNLDVLGPSFLFNLGKNSAMGIFTRARTMFNIVNIDATLYDRFENGFTDNTDYDVSVKDASITTHAWAEFGLSFGKQFTTDKSTFKIGVNAKYLKGFGNGFLKFNDFNGNYIASSNSLATSGEISYGLSDDLAGDYDFAPGANGYGFDLGMIYQWSNNKIEGKRTHNFKRYKYRLGVSITDIGKITYPDATQTEYAVNNSGIDVTTIPDGDIKDVLDAIYPKQSSTEKLTVKLPTAAHINLDIRLNKMLYINLNSDLAVSKNTGNTNQIITTHTLTPRFEKKWISIYSPISIDKYNNFGWGLGMRAGPIFVGSNTILSALLSDSKKVTAHIGVKIPIFKRSKLKLSDKEKEAEKEQEIQKESDEKTKKNDEEKNGKIIK